MIKLRTYLTFGLIACLINLVPVAAKTTTDIPLPNIKVPPLVKEESVSTYLPSEAAPGKGLAINIIYPKAPRYKEGAPIVVVVPGQTKSDGLSITTHASQAGFAELRFAFPGGGSGNFTSTGVYDTRGPICQMALKDILLFAAGKSRDYQDRTINQLVPVAVNSDNLGVLGWSNGGNIALVTMAKYAKLLKPIKWIAFYESPVGSLFYPPNLGGAEDHFVNNHYRLGSCATGNCLVDWRKIAFQTKVQKHPGSHKKAGEPEIPGVIFFDDNKNGLWEESTEFALSYATDIGLEKQFYPPEVIKAMFRLKVNTGFLQWASRLPEAQNYFSERDGSLYIKQVCDEYPHLMVILVGTQVDHLQRQSDHPHIGFLYNAFLTKKLRFLRLNPDARYVANIGKMNVGNFCDNKINAPLDATNMDSFLEPEGHLPDYVYTEAAVSELADRYYTKNWQEAAKAPLVSYSNGAQPATPATAPAVAPSQEKQARQPSNEDDGLFADP